MHSLRSYQLEALQEIGNAFAENRRRLLLVLPTGTGKTVIIAHLLRHPAIRAWLDEYPRHRQRMLVIAHREELLEQAAAQIRAVNPELRVDVEQGAQCARKDADVVIASVATIGRTGSSRLSAIKPSQFRVVVVDEAHHAVASTYLNVLRHFALVPPDGFAASTIRRRGFASEEDYRKALQEEWERQKHSDVALLGVTATPERGDNVGLWYVFDEIVYARGLRDMISRRYLCRLRAYKVESVESIDDVHVRQGDFIQSELSHALNTRRRNDLIISESELSGSGGVGGRPRGPTVPGGSEGDPFNASKRPPQSPQRHDLLLFFVVQDVAHRDVGNREALVAVNVSVGQPEWPVFRCRSVAGFGCPPRVPNKMLQRHEMAGREWFVGSLHSEQLILGNALGLLERGEGDVPYCLKIAFHSHLHLAQLGLILESPHAEVVDHLSEAVSWGLRLLACRDSGLPFGAAEVELEVNDDGAAREVGRRPASSGTTRGPRPISIVMYQEVLHCAVAFGAAEQRREAASYPAERYRSSGEIVGQAWFVDLEAQKTYLLGDSIRARALSREAMAKETESAARPGMESWLALYERDWRAFETHLTEFLAVYRKEKARAPGDSAGILTTFGMALCRLAIEAGYVPAERPYLPLSLLPNWPGERSSVS